MNTKPWHIIRIVIALAGIALIIYTLVTARDMDNTRRFMRVIGLLIFTGYLVSAVLRYRKGSDVSGS